MSAKLYRIEEVSLRTGLTKRTLRYYEDLGLLNPIRTEASYRLYSEEDVENVIKIKEIKGSLGFSLGEVKDIFDLKDELKKILNDKYSDKSLIENYTILIKNQLELIEGKEKTLQKLKAWYIDILSKLEASYNNTKEKNTNEED